MTRAKKKIIEESPTKIRGKVTKVNREATVSIVSRKLIDENWKKRFKVVNE